MIITRRTENTLIIDTARLVSALYDSSVTPEIDVLLRQSFRAHEYYLEWSFRSVLQDAGVIRNTQAKPQFIRIIKFLEQ